MKAKSIFIGKKLNPAWNGVVAIKAWQWYRIRGEDHKVEWTVNHTLDLNYSDELVNELNDWMSTNVNEAWVDRFVCPLDRQACGRRDTQKKWSEVHYDQYYYDLVTKKEDES